MSVYIYCPFRSESAFDLAKALGASRIRRFDGLDFWDKAKRFSLSEGDKLICWGATIPELDGIKVLNACSTPLTKLEVYKKLKTAGVPTVGWNTSPRYISEPRVARSNSNGSQDLLKKAVVGDFYVHIHNFINEYRIHSFGGKSKRAGIRVPREGFTPVTEANFELGKNQIHPWIRTYECGWKIKTDEFKSNQKLRAVAHKAVESLGLTFGAVDIGETQEGNLLVIGVSAAPKLDAGSLKAYTKAINAWIEGAV